MHWAGCGQFRASVKGREDGEIGLHAAQALNIVLRSHLIKLLVRLPWDRLVEHVGVCRAALSLRLQVVDLLQQLHVYC